jgi:hypothetical protein
VAGLSGPIRRTCLHQSRLLGMASYYMLSSCVRVELQATQDLDRRR